MISSGVTGINQSKFFAGIIMLILNIGSKFITVKFSDSQEAYLRNALGRQVLIFAISFVATKDLLVSLALTAIFSVLADYLFNENSRFCILPDAFKKLQKAIDVNDDGIISDGELNDAIKVLNKAKKQKQIAAQKKAYEQFVSKI